MVMLVPVNLHILVACYDVNFNRLLLLWNIRSDDQHCFIQGYVSSRSVEYWTGNMYLTNTQCVDLVFCNLSSVLNHYIVVAFNKLHLCL
jgi:hypothetical protein